MTCPDLMEGRHLLNGRLLLLVLQINGYIDDVMVPSCG